MAVKTPWQEFDQEINLYLKLVGTFMNRWSISSAELMGIILRDPDITQEETGKMLGIKQSGVNGRWNNPFVHSFFWLQACRYFRHIQAIRNTKTGLPSPFHRLVTTSYTTVKIWLAQQVTTAITSLLSASIIFIP